MERKNQRGVSCCSSTSSPRTRSVDEHVIIEHRIRMPDLEYELTQQTDEHPPPLMSEYPLYSSPRRRIHPNFNSNPINKNFTSSIFNNNNNNNYISRSSMGVRVCRLIGAPRDGWPPLLHAFPVIVLLCFFLLWWFSSPVSLAIKDGRIIENPLLEKPVPLNDTELTLSRMTILAVETSPIHNIQNSAQHILSVIGIADDPSPVSSSN